MHVYINTLYLSFLNIFKKIKAKRLEIDQGDKNEKWKLLWIFQ